MKSVNIKLVHNRNCKKYIVMYQEEGHCIRSTKKYSRKGKHKFDYRKQLEENEY